MKKKSLTKNAVLNVIKSLMAIIFPLITFPYVSGVLGVENIGRYNFSLSVISYYLMVAALGISTYAIREGAALRGDRQALSEFSSEILTLNLWSTLVAYILLGISIAAIPKFRDYYDLLLVFSVEILFTTIGVEWVFTIFEEYTYITIRRIAFQLLSLVLLFIFVKKPDDVIIYAAITVCANAGANFFNLIFKRKYVDIRLKRHINLKKHLKPILIIFASTIAIKVYTGSDTVMLGFMLGESGDYYVGLYSVAIKVYNLIRPLITAVTVVAVPRLSAYVADNETDKVKETTSKIFNILLILALPAAVGIFMISDKIILLLSNSSFLSADLSLKLFCAAIIFSTLSAFCNNCIMIPHKKEKQFLIVTIASAVINIILNAVLIPFYDITGAAIATVVAEFISMVMCFIFTRKTVKITNFLWNLVSVAVGCVGIMLCCHFLGNIHISAFTARINNICEILICCCASVAAYFVVLLILRNQYLLQFIDKIIHKRKRRAVEAAEENHGEVEKPEEENQDNKE